nr:unnamed protein product [Digitaria exilis]
MRRASDDTPAEAGEEELPPFHTLAANTEELHLVAPQQQQQDPGGREASPSEEPHACMRARTKLPLPPVHHSLPAGMHGPGASNNIRRLFELSSSIHALVIAHRGWLRSFGARKNSPINRL